MLEISAWNPSDHPSPSGRTPTPRRSAWYSSPLDGNGARRASSYAVAPREKTSARSNPTKEESPGTPSEHCESDNGPDKDVIDASSDDPQSPEEEETETPKSPRRSSGARYLASPSSTETSRPPLPPPLPPLPLPPPSPLPPPLVHPIPSTGAARPQSASLYAPLRCNTLSGFTSRCATFLACAYRNARHTCVNTSITAASSKIFTPAGTGTPLTSDASVAAFESALSSDNVPSHSSN